MKTRILALLLAFSMLLCLTACSGGEGSAANFSRGTVSDGVYTNSFAGIVFSIPEEWDVYSNEELEEMYGSILTSDEDGKMLTCYDFVAQAKDGTSFTVSYENLGFLYGITIDEEEYLELMLEELRSQMQSAYGDTVCETGRTSVSGKIVPCINATVEVDGMKVCSCFVPKKVGDVMAGITVGALSENAVKEVLTHVNF